MRILLEPNPPEGGDSKPTITKSAPRPGVAAKPGDYKPIAAKAPPKEVLEQTFKMDDTIFNNVGSLPQRVTNEDGDPLKVDKTPTKVDEPEKKVEPTIKPPTEKKVEQKKEEVKVKEPKKEEKKDEETKLSSFLKPPGGKKEVDSKPKEDTKKITPPAVDLSIFAPEEQPILKQMSNEAKEFTKKLKSELTELKKNKQDLVYNHPLGYTLDPTYQKTLGDINLASRASKFWEEQLLLIDQGKPFRSIVGTMPDGSFQVSNELQPTKLYEEKVRSNMNNCAQTAQQLQGQLQTYPQQYEQRVKADLAGIQAERASRFAWVSDPSIQDYTINMGPELGEKSIKEVRQGIVDLFPPYMRNHPACEVVGDMYVALRIQDLELQQAKGAAEIANTKKEEVQRAEPTSLAKPQSDNGEAIGGVKQFSLAGLPT